jgi:hypothetical protein
MVKKKINRFINFWRGDESLTFSFWVVYFIGLSILSAPLIYIDIQGEAFIDSMSDGMALLFLIVTFIFYPALVYVYVGLYRSTSKYILLVKKKGKSAIWGYLVYVWMFLSIIRLIREFI